MSDLEILKPTYFGYIGNTEDAILVIQAVLNKELEPVTRRLDPKERNEVIVLGNVFAFIEQSSKIKRWTDGKRWSASRILGRFLMYRELDESNPNDNQSRGKRKRHNISRSNSVSSSTPSSLGVIGSNASEMEASSALAELNKNNDTTSSTSRIVQLPLRQGCDSMDYRSGYIACPAKHDSHLIKKTISFMVEIKDDHSFSTWRNIHLISYFSPMDVVAQTLVRPTATKLAATPISPELQEAVDKVLLNMKPIPGDLEAYFLDSKYQLLKLLAPHKVLPILNYDQMPNMKPKQEKLELPIIQSKGSFEAKKSILPNQRQVQSFMDSHMYPQQLSGFNSVANETVHRGEANMPHFPPTPLDSSSVMSKPIVPNLVFGGSASSGLDDTILNRSSQATQTISSSGQTSQATQTVNTSLSPSHSQSQVQSFLSINSSLSTQATQPLLFSQASMSRSKPLPIFLPGSVGGQVVNKILGSGHQYAWLEQQSPQQTSLFLGSTLAGTNGIPIYFPSYSNTYGYRPELDALTNMQRRFYTDYHVSNTHPTSMGSYSLGHEQPYGGNVMYATGYDQLEPHSERQESLSTGRRLDSPLGYELPGSFYRAPSKPEYLEAGQHYDENYQRI